MAVVEQPLHRAARPDRRRARADRADARTRAQPQRARDVRRRCGRSTARTSPRRSTCARCRPRGRRSWSGPGRTPARSTSATASRWSSRWSRTRIRARSSRTRARPPGVGGIVRDIISMGARPVALLDPLMFGPLTDERNRWLLGGRGRRHRRVRQLHRRPDRRRRDPLRRAALREPERQRDVRRHRAGGRADDVGVPHRARGLVAGPVRRVDRARRHRRRVRARQRHARGRRARARGRPCRSATRSRASC